MVDIMKKKYFPWCRGGRGRGLQDSPGQCRADKARQGGGLIGAAAPEDTGHNVRVDARDKVWSKKNTSMFEVARDECPPKSINSVNFWCLA